MVYKILCVDDEKSVLSSIKRLFLDDSYQVLTASSGVEGLELLKEDKADIIISDQRMPEMSGAEFLTKSKEFSPDAIRIILTGYANIDTAIESINKGEVYRYITKPWNNDDLKSVVRGALELKTLRKENDSLLELTKTQNTKLKDLNANLKDLNANLKKEVDDQTAELRKMVAKLNMLNNRVNSNFMNTVKVLSNIVRIKVKTDLIRFNSVPKLSKSIAESISLSKSEVKDIVIASMLRDIGIIGIDDHVLSKPFANMSSKEQAIYVKHPELSQAAIQSIDDMENVGDIIIQHHERWDGNGYPHNSHGENIKLGARIIVVASDYNGLMNGEIMPSKFTKNEAVQFIISNSGKLYDPKIVTQFSNIIRDSNQTNDKSSDIKISSSELQPGMVLTMDVHTSGGLLLLNEGQEITEKHIDNILHFERAEGKRYEIVISSKSCNPK